MMKKTLFAIALAAVPATIASASQYNHVGGTVCMGYGGQIPNVAVYSSYGLMNTSASSDLRPVCEVPFNSTTIGPSTVNPSQGRVEFVDSNTAQNPSFTGAVRCNMNLSISGGTIVSMGTRYSCATPGGCTDGNNAYSGLGYLLFPDTVGSTANVIATNFDCVLPPYEAGWLGPSIAGVSVSTSTP